MLPAMNQIILIHQTRILLCEHSTFLIAALKMSVNLIHQLFYEKKDTESSVSINCGRIDQNHVTQ